MNRAELASWLGETDETRLHALFASADRVRRETVGDDVHLRALIEVSNYCRRQCAYCGLRQPNASLVRYRMSIEQILQRARAAEHAGFGTVVLQAGEDPTLDAASVVGIIRELKRRTSLAVTLSLGERAPWELREFRRAGADRYLLRFETSNQDLLRQLHPSLEQRAPSRLDLLAELRNLGYEVGSGVMVGLPGTTFRDLVTDLLLFKAMDLDMVGVGPFVPHPRTPLGLAPSPMVAAVPATAEMTYRVLALTRLLCPEANIPATTALTTLEKTQGRTLALTRGANVWMPSVTPAHLRAHYEIYPGKSAGSPGLSTRRIRAALDELGRYPGRGRGDRMRAPRP